MAIKDAISYLKSTPTDNTTSVSMLVRITGPEDVPELIRALHRESGFIQQHVAKALARVIKDHPEHWNAAVPPLIVALRSYNQTIIASAASALGVIGDARAVPGLTDVLKARHWFVRNPAFEALVKIETRTPGSVNLDDVKKSLKELIEKSGDRESETSMEAAKKEASEYYIQIVKAVNTGRGRVELPGEVLRANLRPPKGRMFRQRRVAHA